MDPGSLLRTPSSLFAEGKTSVRAFTRNAPSLGALLASRDATFERPHAILPSTAVAGESVSLTVLAWDGYERLVRDFDGTLSVESTDPDATHPDDITFDPGGAERGGLARETVTFRTPGVQYLTLEHEGGGDGEPVVSNPVEVHSEQPERQVYWGDIHLHSTLSDGVGSIEKGMRFGREVMDLDVVAYTDHDTMGFFIPPDLQRRRMHRYGFERTKDAIEAHHDPGSFVTLFGYEWTKQPTHGGHINVYFDDVDSAELFDSRTEGTDTYEGLWERLREWRSETGRDVVTIPHHPAEEMYPFDFSATRYDDEMAPLVEVYSQWGSSEYPGAEGNPKPIGGIAKGETERPGHHVRDVLAMGHRVGMLASSDYHGPRPGHSLIHVPPHLPSLADLRDGLGWGTIWRLWDEASYPGGLTAFHAPELTRGAVFDALRGRQVYGTTQPDRILVHFAIRDGGGGGETRLGDPDSVHSVDARDGERTVSVSVAGTAPVERAVVVKNNATWRTAEPVGEGLDAYTVEAEFPDSEPVTGMAWDDDRGTDDDIYYLRVHQRDGGMAWAGPIWVAVDG